MSFTFKTKVLGVEMDVSGYFDYDGFELEAIYHRGYELDFDGLADQTLVNICEDALKASAQAALEMESDEYADRFREYGSERFDN